MFSRPVPYPLDWEGWMVANIYGTMAESTEDGGDVVHIDTLSEEGVELKSGEEINAMGRKADLIAYAESIGLSGLTDKMSLDELKSAVLNYQDENYGE